MILRTACERRTYHLPLWIGAILERAPEEGEQPQMKGSVMLAQAESKEAVLEVLKEDTYYKSGVWDWEKVQIHPVSFLKCRPNPSLVKESSVIDRLW